MGDSRLVHGAKTRRLHLELGIKRKRREEKMAEVSFALLCPSRTAESHSQIVVSALLFRNLIARGAGSLRPSSGCTCFGLDQFLASASLVSHFSAPLLVVLDACPVVDITVLRAGSAPESEDNRVHE